MADWTGSGEQSGDILYREISLKDFVQEIKSIMAGAVGLSSGSPGAPEIQRELNASLREMSLRIQRTSIITLPELNTDDKYELPISILKVNRVWVDDVEVPIANCSYAEWQTDEYRALVLDDVYIGEDRYLRFREDIDEDNEVKLSVWIEYEPSVDIKNAELLNIPYMFYDAIKFYIISHLYLYARYLNPDLSSLWERKYEKKMAELQSQRLTEQTFMYGTL